jgi:ArsR family transcriptional regulator, arsenate/arsenite/antimonite-responsive transcriptional repressor
MSWQRMQLRRSITRRATDPYLILQVRSVTIDSTVVEVSCRKGCYLPVTNVTAPDYSTIASLLKVVSDPRRLQILDLLMNGVQCNCEIGDHLDMAPNLISHHLGVLRRAGLVLAERDPDDARWVYYSVNAAVLAEMSRVLGEFFDPERIQPRRPDCGPVRQQGRC